MKNILRFASIVLFLIAVSVGYSAVPAVNVTVSDAGGKVAFKGATSATGTFATPKLKPGNYVVQFNSSSPALKGHQYTLVISAGKKKVSADSVAGEKFLSGGVAMKLEVGSGLNITGQVAAPANVKIDPKTKKKMVYIPPTVGSNMPGRWVPEDSAEAVAARNTNGIRTEDVRKMQEHETGAIPGN
ncbi:MAG: hypothetical protein QOK24_1336 [Verrucomicrobiota bacterium]|jgi:hypothetical protein